MEINTPWRILTDAVGPRVFIADRNNTLIVEIIVQEDTAEARQRGLSLAQTIIDAVEKAEDN